MSTKGKSPFTPGSPVSSELFVGRENLINQFRLRIEQTSLGKQENIFLIGDRGMGKSSLASFIRHSFANQADMIGIHLFLGEVSTLEEMVQRIFEQLLREVEQQPWFEDVKKLFGNYVKQIGLFGVSVSFNPPESDLNKLVRKFPEALKNLLSKIRRRKQGIFIVLDDIYKLTETVEFANWYKSFVDEVATSCEDFPVFIVLIGLPESRESLSKLQPSLMRIFRVIELERLSDQEVCGFLTQAFNKVNVKFTPGAIQIMAWFSSGLPILMQEIGDAAFELDQDNLIDEQDASNAVVEAATRVGQKYLDPQVYSAIRSPLYRSILRKFGELRDKKRFLQNFNKKEFEDLLTDDEKRVFHNFLRRMKELGVIEDDKESGIGCYRFVNKVYPIYIYMESKISASNRNRIE